MPVTPSLGIDQNEKKRFIDRYWGRVPQFLIYQPENFICEANQDYLYLMNLFLSGELIRENISQELWNELEMLILNLKCPCLMSMEDRAIIDAFYGKTPCENRTWKLNCDEMVCCNEVVLCQEPTLCTSEK
jgi:hypothetical protein